jgi:hypothetical protein
MKNACMSAGLVRTGLVGMMLCGAISAGATAGLIYPEGVGQPAHAHNSNTLHRPVAVRRNPGWPNAAASIWTYDGPVYNWMGQVTGTYHGPVLAYSSSCNILTPVGYLITCQAFTW